MSELDLSFRPIEPVPRGPNRPAKLAIAAAILLHLALAVWLLARPYDEAAPEPPVIAVTLVTVPPPPPPPAPVQQQPKPEPQPEQKPLAYRESGPDQRTTQAPRAEEKAPEPSAPPQSTDTATKAAEEPTTAAPTKEGLEPPPPEKPHPAAPSQPAPEKPKLALRAPKVEPPIDDRMLGEDDESGDPYLNGLWSRIEANRKPTTPIGPAGLHLAGISTYRLVLDRYGRMEGIDLLSSSGSTLLDDEAKRMIVAATPFPPLPPDYPNQIALRVTIRLYPR